jgi:hypothetical protein
MAETNMPWLFIASSGLAADACRIKGVDQASDSAIA